MRKRSVVEWNKIHNVARDKRIKFSREQKKLRWQEKKMGKWQACFRNELCLSTSSSRSVPTHRNNKLITISEMELLFFPVGSYFKPRRTQNKKPTEAAEGRVMDEGRPLVVRASRKLSGVQLSHRGLWSPCWDPGQNGREATHVKGDNAARGGKRRLGEQPETVADGVIFVQENGFFFFPSSRAEHCKREGMF